MTVQETQAFEYSLVPAFEKDDLSYIETFHEYTKLNRENIGLLSQRVGMIVNDARIRAMMARSWKTYRGYERIPLPEASLGSMTLADALMQRQSVSSTPGATFSSAPVTVAQLSALLRFSYGVTRSRSIPGTDQTQHFRTTTSAGGLFPLEIYPLVFNVDGLNQGIYHYRVVDHSLEVVRPEPCLQEFLGLTSYKELCEQASVVFVVSAVFQRNLCKYLHRGYRFLMNDAGALLQSFYLTGTALRLGTCALGGFFDDELGNLVGLNNVDEAPVICFLVGNLKGV